VNQDRLYQIYTLASGTDSSARDSAVNPTGCFERSRQRRFRQRRNQ